MVIKHSTKLEGGKGLCKVKKNSKNPQNKWIELFLLCKAPNIIHLTRLSKYVVHKFLSHLTTAQGEIQMRQCCLLAAVNTKALEQVQIISKQHVIG